MNNKIKLPPGDPFAKVAQHLTSIQINYDRARTRLIQISGSDKLINIIEAESGDSVTKEFNNSKNGILEKAKGGRKGRPCVIL